MSSSELSYFYYFYSLHKEHVMLVFSRKVGESFLIGDDVRVTVLGIQRNQVRIGVAAPTAISVDREEIREKKNREKEEA